MKKKYNTGFVPIPTGSPNIVRFTISGVETWTGDITGTRTFDNHGFLNFKTGFLSVTGTGTFTGSIHGVSGVCETIEYGDVEDFFGVDTLNDNFKFHNCTGDLAGASAQVGAGGLNSDVVHVYTGNAHLPG